MPRDTDGTESDATGTRTAEERLRDSERRLRTLIEGIPQLVWLAAKPGEWVWSSPQWTGYTGLSPEESRGDGWLEAVHPEDREAARDAWRMAEGLEAFEADYRIRDGSTGCYRWFQTRAAPSFDDDGRIVEWFGTSTDVDDILGLREEQRALVAELQHRVRNTLGVIRSMVRRTAETAGGTEDYAMHLEGRIDAFGRVQSAVTRAPFAGVELEHLIANELVAHAAREGEGVHLEGPPVRLKPKAAETLGLAIHELATNAVKFGALSASGGTLAVTWRVERQDDERSRLVVEWKEQGLADPPSAPARRGFGTDLLERTLAYELRARARRNFEPDGVRCIIEVPLTPRTIVDEVEQAV